MSVLIVAALFLPLVCFFFTEVKHDKANQVQEVQVTSMPHENLTKTVNEPCANDSVSERLQREVMDYYKNMFIQIIEFLIFE